MVTRLVCLAVLAAQLGPAYCFAWPRVASRAAIPPLRVTTSSYETELPPVALAGTFACKSMGACVPCPAEELGSPVCKVYGHRRALVCTDTSLAPPTLAELSADDRSPSPSRPDDTDVANEQAAAPPEKAPAPPQAVDRQANTDPDPQNLDEEDLQDKLRENGLHPRDLGSRRLAAGHRHLSIRDAGSEQDQQGRDLFTWEACSRVVSQERADFFEFVLCNFVFAVVSVIVLWYRHRTLASRQYGTLAARIGVREYQ